VLPVAFFCLRPRPAGFDFAINHRFTVTLGYGGGVYGWSDYNEAHNHKDTLSPQDYTMTRTVIPFLCAVALAATLPAADFHVAPNGNDANPGTPAAPLRTIQRAADLAQPGDVVTVHEGVYRQRISPPRGGDSDAKRIVYQAAPGEKVEIKGSEVVKDWAKVQGDVWKVIIPNSFFGGFNPYSDLIRGDWFDPKRRQHHTGAVYLNGDWLSEAARLDDVLKPAATAPLWFGQVDKEQTTIWAQFKGLNPNEQAVEINVRQTVFYPEKTGINYLTVRGFTLRDAATPWAPPTAEQIGLIGTHWSKGWIIENNVISHSVCSGISLGKYGDQWDNKSANSAEGYVKTIERALENGWNKQTIGHHLVRNNVISHCEQAGIVGSLGAAFSVVTGNTIHDIHVRQLFGGCEMAGIKFHGAIDVEISRNHIYRTCRGVWLDWMAQGTRVSRNLFHDNATAENAKSFESGIAGGQQDMFVEVNHGPFLVDNNIFLSPYSLNNRSQGGAYVHNLFAGAVRIVVFDGRMTPFHKAHSTEVAGLHDNPCGDDRYYNNLFVERADLSPYDAARLPVGMDGNVFLQGAKPCKHEDRPLVQAECDPALKIIEKADGFYLQVRFDKAWAGRRTRKLATADRLGKATIANLPYEQADGTPICIDTDYFGKSRSASNPTPGPFENPGQGNLELKVQDGVPGILAPQRAGPLAAFPGPEKTWTLQSGGVQYQLRQSGQGIDVPRFAPAAAAGPAEPAGFCPDLRGRVEGRDVTPQSLQLVDAREQAGAGQKLQLTYRDRVLPLEIRARYAAWGETGTITRQLTLVNRGQHVLHVESFPSLSWQLPAGDYQLTTLQGSWGQERQVVTERLGDKAVRFESALGRSTARMSPWFSLHDQRSGLRYLAQLAWSGNWNLAFERSGALPSPTGRGTQRVPGEAGDLRVELGLRGDFNGPIAIAPGEALELPAVAFTVTSGDLDDAANALHRYQRQFVVPRNPANNPPLVQFNSWYPFPGKMNIADMKRCADIAAKIGAEVFVLDAGWYNKVDWCRELGDWQPDRKAFPKGTAELAEHVHSQGMRFGIWMEIECLGGQSEMFKRHADWCLKCDGQAVNHDLRYQLNFGKAEVRQWALAEMDRIIREHGLDWVKIDYNVNIGERFDAADGTRPGDVHYRHVRGYYAWLDELRRAHPRLVVENCSSGGLRFDLGIIAHTHTTWLSDRTMPKPSLQLAYGSTLEFAPQVCNHWMVGDDEAGRVSLASPPGWWQFMFRVPMNGQFGISSRVFDWSEPLMKCAAENVALYKRIRATIAAGDCYHLTPPPARENPKGWMALQYVAPGAKRSVVMAYRLGESQPTQTFRLRGLAPRSSYRVRSDGQSTSERNGAQLAAEGIAISLPDPWRAAVLELEPK
jgi:alpha-N-arabinofuranosidase